MDKFVNNNVYLMLNFMSHSNKLLRNFYSSFYLLPTKKQCGRLTIECIVWFDNDMNFRITWHRFKFTAWVFYLHLDCTNLSIFASQLCYIISISNVRIIFSLRMIFHFYITCESCEAFTMILIKQIRIWFVIYFQSLAPTLPNGNVKDEYKQILSITGIICESA